MAQGIVLDKFLVATVARIVGKRHIPRSVHSLSRKSRRNHRNVVVGFVFALQEKIVAVIRIHRNSRRKRDLISGLGVYRGPQDSHHNHKISSFHLSDRHYLIY